MSTPSYHVRSVAEIATNLSDHAWRIVETFIEARPQPLAEEVLQPVVKETSLPTPVAVTLTEYEQAWQTVEAWMKSEEAPFISVLIVLTILFLSTCILSYKIMNTRSRLRSLESMIARLQAQVKNLEAGGKHSPDDDPSSPGPEKPETSNPAPQESRSAESEPQFQYLKNHYIQWESISFWRRAVIEDFADYSQCKVFPCPPPPQWDEGGICTGRDCHIFLGPLPLAACCIRKIFQSVPDLNLKVERRRWHPDRFSASMEDRREYFRAYAHQIFVVLEEMWREECERGI